MSTVRLVQPAPQSPHQVGHLRVCKPSAHSTAWHKVWVPHALVLSTQLHTEFHGAAEACLVSWLSALLGRLRTEQGEAAGSLNIVAKALAALSVASQLALPALFSCPPSYS